MQTNGYRNFIRSGILAAAAGFLASNGHAAPWCPTHSDNTITCSGCSRELICDLYGFNIIIKGNDVTLDGQGYTIYGSPSYGAMFVHPTTGPANATIKNLNIEGGHSGIFYLGPSSSSWGHVQNVTINGVIHEGFTNAGSSVEISNSYVYNNDNGVIGTATSGRYTDFLSSSCQGNARVGYMAGANPNGGSWVKSSFFWNNAAKNVSFVNAPWSWVDNTSMTTSDYGVYVANSPYARITYNYGANNNIRDCYIQGSPDFSASVNTWTSQPGWSACEVIP